MGYVDFILNLAGLLLWLNWRSVRFNPLNQRTPATLMGTLRPAAPKRLRPWHLLACIVGLLGLRALFYWQIGSAAGGTTFYLDMGVTAPGFRRDVFWQVLAFSFFSFGRALGIFYLWLLGLSLLKGPAPMHGLVKIPLGRVDLWPSWAKILLPFVATTLLWLLAGWLFGALKILPAPASPAQRLGQAAIIGLESYLVWRFPIGVILALQLLNSYVYFGKQPLWEYVRTTARTLLRPLDKIPLQLGRVDFAPVVGIALVFFAAELASRWLAWGYAR